MIATKAFPYPKKILIQTKGYRDTNSVSGPELQRYASLKQRENVDEVVIITTSGFTNQAEVIAGDFDINLMWADLLQKVEWMMYLFEERKANVPELPPELAAAVK